MRDKSPGSTTSEPSSIQSSSTVRKRSITATSSWDYARKPKDKEPERAEKGRNRIFYCKICLDPLYSVSNPTSARYHLKAKHGIIIADTQRKAKKLRTERLEKHLGKDRGNSSSMVKELRRESALISAKLRGFLGGSYLTYNSSQPTLQRY